jgi:hypothetical protein
MQAISAFNQYQAGPEMSEFDITPYFDLSAASSEDVDMNKWVENAVSSHYHFSDSMDVDMTTDAMPVEYAYDEFGECYVVQKQACEADPDVLMDDAGFNAFLAEINDEYSRLPEEKARAKKDARKKAQDKYNRKRRDAAQAAAAAALPQPKLIHPFNDQTVKADLIRCQPIENHDTIEIFAIEYVRGLRLLQVKRRWRQTSRGDWNKEVRLLVKAAGNPKGDLKLWQPLADWLALWKKYETRDKQMMVQLLEQSATEVMAESRASMEELLAANGMAVPKRSWYDAQFGVEEDCEERGNLLLGTIPEFTQAAVQGFSSARSWTEERTKSSIKATG